MATLTRTLVVDAAALAALRRPRDDLVREAVDPDDPDRLVAVEGPCRAYERRLHIEPSPDDGDRFVATETISYDLHLPFWGPFLRIPFRRALRRRDRLGGQPWWAPPVRLDPRQASVLCRLAVLALCAGYLGTLLSQTTTFAAGEFGATSAAQGAALAATRIGILVALVATFVSDRLGRRRTLLVALSGAALMSVTTALTPSLIWFAGTQVIARGLTTGADIVRAVILAEEMPAGARAYAISVNAMASGLGSGMVVWFLPITDLAPWAWRLLFLLPIVIAPLVLFAGRPLPESRRFEQHRHDTGERPRLGSHRNRLALLAVSALATNLFAAPASSLQNEYLRTERSFSGADITAFTLLTSTPAGLGVFFGGRLADVHGRRRIGAIGIVGGTLGVLVSYWFAGPGLWLGAALGTITAGLVVPALLVYGPELFPTRLRGRANGVITMFGVTGSAIGLLSVGAMAHAWGAFGPAVSVVAVGPLLVALLVITRYPETAHRELEELNPSDRVADGPSAQRPGSEDGGASGPPSGPPIHPAGEPPR